MDEDFVNVIERFDLALDFFSDIMRLQGWHIAAQLDMHLGMDEISDVMRMDHVESLDIMY